MLFPNSEPPFGGHAGLASAYGKIIRETENPRSIEYRVFDRVTTALEDANLPGTPARERIAAAHDNHELWVTLTCDAASENNALPETLRATIISLGLWVVRETPRVMQQGGSLGDLIAVNRAIMRGLHPASQGND
jgi:flagellar protein FlaF